MRLRAAATAREALALMPGGPSFLWSAIVGNLAAYEEALRRR